MRKNANLRIRRTLIPDLTLLTREDHPPIKRRLHGESHGNHDNAIGGILGHPISDVSEDYFIWKEIIFGRWYVDRCFLGSGDFRSFWNLFFNL